MSCDALKQMFCDAECRQIIFAVLARRIQWFIKRLLRSPLWFVQSLYSNIPPYFVISWRRPRHHTSSKIIVCYVAWRLPNEFECNMCIALCSPLESFLFIIVALAVEIQCFWARMWPEAFQWGKCMTMKYCLICVDQGGWVPPSDPSQSNGGSG